MHKITHYLFRDDFITKSLLFFVATGCISFLNYVYHPILGNIISLKDFGEVETIYSLYNVFGIFLFTFSSVIIHITANSEKEDDKKNTLGTIGIFGVGASLVIALIVIILSPFLKHLFHFSEVGAFIIFATLLPLSTYVFFGAAYFQGLKKVWAYASGNGIVSVLKLGIAIAFVILGQRVFGVVLGFLIAQFFGAVYMYVILRKELPIHTNLTGLFSRKSLRLSSELRFAGMIFVTSLSLVLFSNGDILFVKYLFNPEAAGIYSGISAIGNIVYFSLTPVAAVLLASIKLKNTQKQNHRILFLAGGIVLVVGGALCLIFASWHSTIISTLLGKKFEAFSSYLPSLGLLMLITALQSTLLTYYLALRKKIVFVPAMLGVVALPIIVFLRHESLQDVITGFIAVILGVFVVTLSHFLFTELFQKKTTFIQSNNL